MVLKINSFSNLSANQKIKRYSTQFLTFSKAAPTENLVTNEVPSTSDRSPFLAAVLTGNLQKLKAIVIDWDEKQKKDLLHQKDRYQYGAPHLAFFKENHNGTFSPRDDQEDKEGVLELLHLLAGIGTDMNMKGPSGLTGMYRKEKVTEMKNLQGVPLPTLTLLMRICNSENMYAF